MKPIRKANLNKLVATHLNFNSKRNKFKALIQNVSGEVDLLIISETKNSNPFRIDQNVHGGGMVLYVREDVHTKLLSKEPILSECFFVEFNLRE